MSKQEGIPGWDYAAPPRFNSDGLTVVTVGMSLIYEGRREGMIATESRMFSRKDFTDLARKDQAENLHLWEERYLLSREGET